MIFLLKISFANTRDNNVPRVKEKKNDAQENEN